MSAKTFTVALLAFLSAVVAKRLPQNGNLEVALIAGKPKPAVSEFLDRVFDHLPAARGTELNFNSWRFADRPTKEGAGVMSIAGVDVDKVAAAIMNVGEYRGHIDYVEESRVIPDRNYKPPKSVHVYQRLKLPVLPSLQNEIALQDFGMRGGWRVLAWQLLDDETERLDPRKAARFEYNVGAWLLRPDAVAFAASSAPRKSDVGAMSYAILTKGADATAKTAIKVNIKGMVAWSAGKHQGHGGAVRGKVTLSLFLLLLFTST